MPETTSVSTSPRKVLRLVFGGLVLIAGLCVFWWIKDSGLLSRSLEWIKSLGPWAPLVFVILYVSAVVVCLPASILTAGGGFIFGMTSGSVYVLTGATIAGNLTFLLGRYIARDWIARKLQEQPRFKAIDEAVGSEGWKIVALVRLAPIFPFSITSYAFGLTRIPFWKYFLANFTMLPSVLMYVYFGSVGRDLTASKPLWLKCTVGVLMAVVVFYLARFAKRALSQRIS